MKNLHFILFMYLFCIGIVSCLHAQQGAEPEVFRLPDIPDILIAPKERATYLAVHYWDHFNFTDTSLISKPEITEQAFVDFISILPYTEKAATAVDTLFHRASAKKEILYHFISLGDMYLYEPNSPMHNEELYILMLCSLLKTPGLDEADKERPRHLLKIAQKNRPGDVAADFTYRTRDGSRNKSRLRRTIFQRSRLCRLPTGEGSTSFLPYLEQTHGFRAVTPAIRLRRRQDTGLGESNFSRPLD